MAASITYRGVTKIKRDKKPTKTIIRGGGRKSPGLGPGFMLLFLLCGIFGMIIYFDSVPGIVFSRILVYSAAAGCCVAYVFLFYRDPVYFYTVAVAAVLICIMAAAREYELILAQLKYAADLFSASQAAEPPSLTLLALTTIPIVTLILFMLEAVAKSRSAMLVITAAMLLAAPVLGSGSSAALLLTAVSACAFLAAQPERRGAASSSGIRQTRAGVICVILAAAALISALVVMPNLDRLSDLTYSAEGRIFREIAMRTGRATDFVQGGSISRFNNYQTDREQLIVQITRAPEEPIYLKGFVGGDYDRGEWTAADDTAILNDIQEKYQNNWGVLGISNTYSSLYFTMNMNTTDDTIPPPGSMAVRYISSEGKNYYVPYYSRVETIYVFGGYRFQYYEKGDMKINWNNVPPVFERKRDQCLNLQEAYIEEASRVYTRVPQNQLPRLRELCQNESFETLSEVTDFIKNTLDERTEYTLTPGWSPLNGDVVEDFLFGRGRGYCVHYASAAALMYRLFGFPARYVTGYMIEPEDFERQRYGTYNAVLKDRNSHAWVEIFLRDYGWTPVDLTPISDTPDEVYPGYSEPEKDDDDGGYGLNISLIPKARSDEDSGEENLDEAENAKEKGSEINDYTVYNRMESPIRAFAGMILVGALIALAVLLVLNLLRRRKRADCRTEFARLLRALSAAGIMSGYDGTEPDFCEKLREALPDIDADAMRGALGTVSEAAYGPAPLSAEEDMRARKILRAAADKARKAMPLYKKILFEIKEILI